MNTHTHTRNELLKVRRGQWSRTGLTDQTYTKIAQAISLFFQDFSFFVTVRTTLSLPLLQLLLLTLLYLVFQIFLLLIKNLLSRKSKQSRTHTHINTNTHTHTDRLSTCLSVCLPSPPPPSLKKCLKRWVYPHTNTHACMQNYAHITVHTAHPAVILWHQTRSPSLADRRSGDSSWRRQERNTTDKEITLPQIAAC